MRASTARSIRLHVAPVDAPHEISGKPPTPLSDGRSQDLRDLIGFVTVRTDAPGGLLWWLRHHGPGSGLATLATAWRDCPRGDWMLWIAMRLGVDRVLLDDAHRLLQIAEADAARALTRKSKVRGAAYDSLLVTPVSNAASAMREAVTSRAVGYALERLLQRELTGRDQADFIDAMFAGAKR